MRKMAKAHWFEMKVLEAGDGHATLVLPDVDITIGDQWQQINFRGLDIGNPKPGDKVTVLWLQE